MTRHSDSALTAERARHLLAYDADAGTLTWRNPTARAVKAGDIAGSRGKKGYRYVSLDGRLFSAHRVVWLMVYGKWPQGDVAARNGNFEDLRIGNLYERTALETALSSKKVKAKSGYRGVYQQPNGKWSAQIRRNYYVRHLGSFQTKEAAAAAVVEAQKLDVPPANEQELLEKAAQSRKYGLVHGLWRRTLRDHSVVAEWESFDVFSDAVGDGAYPQCRLVAIDPSKRLGPDNYRIEARAKYDRRTPEGQKAYYDHKNKVSAPQKQIHHRMYMFGLTHEQYVEMLTAHKGVCAICSEPETALRHGKLLCLSVDHCHGSGEVRGLLCRDCNHTLGKMKESPARLRAAADYIERHAARIAKAKASQTSVPASNVVHLKAKER